MTTPSPIGFLILEAERRASTAASRTFTAAAPCGCQVTATWFTERSRTNSIDHCHTHHPHPNQDPTPPGAVRRKAG